MRERLRRIFTVHYPYQNPLDYRRAVTLLWIVFAGAVVSVVVALMGLAGWIGDDPALQPILLASPIYGIAGLVIEYLLIQRGRLQVAIWVMVAILMATTGMAAATLVAPVGILLLPLVAAGLLMNRRSLSVVIALVFVVMCLRAIAQSEVSRNVFTRPSETAGTDFMNGLLMFGAVSLFFLAFSGTAERAAQLSGREADQLRNVSRLSIRFSESLDEDGLLTLILHTAQSELDYTLAQIFLINADQTIGRRVRLNLDQKSVTSTSSTNAGDVMVIGQAARERTIIEVTADDSPPRNIHVIAPSRFAVAVPVIAQDRLLAVLNVQTDRVLGISDNDIEVLQALAEQFSLALSRTRLINDLRRALREQEDNAARMRAQLTDIQGRSQQLALSGWANYVQGRGGVFGYDFSEHLEDESGGKFVLASDMTPAMRESLAQGDIVVERGDEYQVLNAPILLRGQVLGAMSFRLPADQPLSERQRDLARTIAVRLGVALENTRLFEQSQAQAARERKATEVANTLLTMTDMSALVSQAAESFYEALGAVYTRVIVKPSSLDVEVQENGNGHLS